MTNLHIEVGSQPPALEVDPVLRARVQTLVFNNEQFRTGLLETGMPEPAVDSLQLSARYLQTSYEDGGVGTFYDRDRHSLSINLNDYPWLRKKHLTGAWENANKNEPNTTSEIINYYLAYHAKNITDVITRQKTATALDRLNARQIGRRNLQLLSRLSIVGSIVGAEAATDVADYPAVAGSGAGLATAFGVALGVSIFRNNRAFDQSKPLEKELIKRGVNFATSPHARQLFDGVVELEWLKQ